VLRGAARGEREGQHAMNHADPATTPGSPQRTEVGSVFVSNYPPYSAWDVAAAGLGLAALAAAPRPETPLGLYLHVPFCRKRCKFCYFKVFTEKSSADVRRYLDALAREVDLVAALPALAGRRPRFVYFGGGTPSFISARDLRELVRRARAALAWDAVEEVTFECEPGTLTEAKLEAIREVGVTRLSLGVESFDDRILEHNGRAHLAHEIERALPWIRARGFAQLNIDLIAGMVGETWDTWRASVRRTIEIAPDSVTIYQLELPYNTVYSRGLLDGEPIPVADWAHKRAWHGYAFEQLEAAGYEVGSAYTAVRRGAGARFVYRDAVWHGCDLYGVGVASFSHVNGVHFQNVSGWEPYLRQIEGGAHPVERALAPNPRELMTRELILQLKLGRLDAGYFRDKFQVDPLAEFAPVWSRLAADGLLTVGAGEARLTREGLLRVDTLLPEFYDPRYRGARYT